MTNEISVFNFFTDPNVAIVLFFKKDGSVQANSAYSEEKYGQEKTVNLDDTIFIARLMLGGSIDFPYASEDLAFRESKTIISITARNPGEFVGEFNGEFDPDYTGPECNEIELYSCKSYPLYNGFYVVCKKLNEATGRQYCTRTTCTSG